MAMLSPLRLVPCGSVDLPRVMSQAEQPLIQSQAIGQPVAARHVATICFAGLTIACARGNRRSRRRTLRPKLACRSGNIGHGDSSDQLLNPPPALPPCVWRGKLDDVDVYIVGTAHISKQSAEDVSELLERLAPAQIVVELSRDRLKCLVDLHELQASARRGVSLSSTPSGFPRVDAWYSLDDAKASTDPQLIVCGPKANSVEEISLRPMEDDGTWIEDAVARHRYRSETYQLWPAVSLVMTLAKLMVPRTRRALVLSIAGTKSTGMEFKAAAKYAARTGCPMVLGDAPNGNLIDVEGALHVTREDSVLERVAGPFIRGPGGAGVDFFQALAHISAGSGEVLRYVLALVAVAVFLGVFLYLNPHEVLQIPGLEMESLTQSILVTLTVLAMGGLVVSSAVLFLLTANRDEQLSRALLEAAEEAAQTAEKAPVVMVCGLAHVNGIARRVARARSAHNS
mmetsp:Transcript_17778/g.41239  ORF Transcript_17778/g.41239 Transcript_17778/m.41239 type:complete len:456 (+) Transcript_17778:45-1412(+)